MLKDKIESILSDVSSALPQDVTGFKEEIENNLRATLNASFSKLDLVTREEFDIQTALLQRSRAQLDSLQTKLDELESQLSAVSTKE